MNRLIIAIELENGSLFYVRFSENSYRPSLVKKKSQATFFQSMCIAEICSDYFWQNHWQKDEYTSRTVIDWPERKFKNDPNEY